MIIEMCLRKKFKYMNLDTAKPNRVNLHEALCTSLFFITFFLTHVQGCFSCFILLCIIPQAPLYEFYHHTKPATASICGK